MSCCCYEDFVVVHDTNTPTHVPHYVKIMCIHTFWCHKIFQTSIAKPVHIQITMYVTTSASDSHKPLYPVTCIIHA